MQTNHLHNNDLFTMFTIHTMVFKFICFPLSTSIPKRKEKKEGKYKHLNKMKKKEREGGRGICMACFTFKVIPSKKNL